ncbi:MAG: ribonuclease HII [Candidatus Woesearchaeota archaeon]
MIVAGIDEAGRGPVIGPLVLAGVSFDEKKLNELERIGVRDSKLLTQKKREKIFDEILNLSEKHKVIIISPEEIDDYVNKKRLNELEALKIIEIINYLNPDKIIIDCPSNNKKKFEEFLRQRVHNKKIELVVEHKADFKYKVVGAASIIAKVVREREIKKIKEKYKVDFGSGYPSDPLTKKFLKENFKDERLKSIFRKSWSTYSELSGKTKQKNISDFFSKKE